MSRVLLLTSDLARNPAYTACQMAGALRRLGHETRLAGPASGPPWPPLAEELSGAAVLGTEWVGPAGWARARELAADVELVYAFKAFPTSLGLGLALGRRAGIPVLVHLDDWDAGYLGDPGLLRRVWRGVRGLGTPRGPAWLRASEALVPRATEVTVSSGVLRRRYGGTVVPQGVDERHFRPERFPRHEARVRLGLDEREPMILFLGTPTPHKGLDALAGLDVAHRKALWLVGAERRRWVEAGVDEALLDEARVLGPVSMEEAAWHMAAADVFVIPQGDSAFARHQLPAKVVQAMSLGRCVVATRVGGLEEALEGEEPAGILVPAGDPAALAAAVGRALDDPELRARLGRRARARVEASLGWTAMAGALAPVLERMGVPRG